MVPDTRAALAVVAVCASVSAVLAFVSAGTRSRIEDLERENEALERRIAAEREIVAKAPALRERRRLLEANEPAYAAWLPMEASEEKLLALVQKLAGEAEVALLEVSMRPQPPRLETRELRVALRLKGRHEGFVRLLNALERHERPYLETRTFSVLAARELEVEATVELATYVYVPKKA